MSYRKDLAKLQLEISEMIQVYSQIEVICGLYGISDCEIPYYEPTTDDAIADRNAIYFAEQEADKIAE